MSKDSNKKSGSINPPPGNAPPDEELEEFGGGHITARHGKVNYWLLVVYVVLFVWPIYYAFVYWGGLGPGLDY